MLCQVMLSCHCTHAIRCVEHDIHILNLPSNATHHLQVADVSVFGPFKTRLKTAGAKHEHNGHNVVQPHQVASFTRKAWEESATPENINSGFEKTGIFPFNRDRLDKNIFLQGTRHRGTPDKPRICSPPPLPPPPSSMLDTTPT
jgi:hypothetical protein